MGVHMGKETIFASIITSLIASLVFGFAFNFIPFIYRYLHIRPRVEEELADINFHLFFFIQIPFLQSVHTASDFQHDIENNELHREDFENALYGKCLSKERCKGEFEHRLLVVGEELEENSKEIDKRIDRIYRYSDYLTTKEILMITEIGKKIHTYDFNEHVNIVDGVELKAVNPSISYMSGNFYELYILYHAFKDMCDSYCFLRRNDYQKYRIAVKGLENKKYIIFFNNWISLNETYRTLVGMRQQYLKRNMKKVEKKLRKFLKLDSDKQVALNLFGDYLLHENELRNIIACSRGEHEVQEWISCENSEEIRKKQFELRNLDTRRIIEEKIKNVPRITEYGEEQIQAVKKLFNGYL